jgi:hypothetical protein
MSEIEIGEIAVASCGHFKVVENEMNERERLETVREAIHSGSDVQKDATPEEIRRAIIDVQESSEKFFNRIENQPLQPELDAISPWVHEILRSIWEAQYTRFASEIAKELEKKAAADHAGYRRAINTFCRETQSQVNKNLHELRVATGLASSPRCEP